MKYRKTVLLTTGEYPVTLEYNEACYKKIKKALSTKRKTLTINNDTFNLRSIVAIKRV
ncbi:MULTISPECIES: hypothetical protein [Lactococcus]|uniref:Uncharacterized protein n=1 Tax=Lactococcus garvieae TaxID=1363 RepID=A0A6L2ZWG4_9LACT|nr:hypothetical protein [Lactococcus garvieae]GFO52166.1 hypothetical protein ikelab_14410 [Lactococcus garvieae]